MGCWLRSNVLFHTQNSWLKCAHNNLMVSVNLIYESCVTKLRQRKQRMTSQKRSWSSFLLKAEDTVLLCVLHKINKSEKKVWVVERVWYDKKGGGRKMCMRKKEHKRCYGISSIWHKATVVGHQLRIGLNLYMKTNISLFTY